MLQAGNTVNKTNHKSIVQINDLLVKHPEYRKVPLLPIVTAVANA